MNYFKEYYCNLCGKPFICTDIENYVYTSGKKYKRKLFCSWTCMRKYERQEEENSKYIEIPWSVLLAIDKHIKNKYNSGKDTGFYKAYETFAVKIGANCTGIYLYKIIQGEYRFTKDLLKLINKDFKIYDFKSKQWLIK